MVDLTYRDFRENLSSGSPDLLSRVADVARDAACSIYSKSPAAWLSNELPGTPLLDAHRALMDTLCDGVVPPPPPPSPPFVGGQCCEVNYFVSISATLLISNGSSLDFGCTGTVAGKVESVRVENEGSGSQEITKIVINYLGGSECSFPFKFVARSTQVNNSDGTTSVARIDSISVTRNDGLPDTCGNPPSVYPPPNVTINDYDFDTNINFNPSASVSVRVSVQPTVVYNDRRSSPSLTVNVGGISVSASMGGFTFSPTVVFGGGDKIPTFDPRPVPPPTVFPPPALPPGGDAKQFDDLKRKIDDLKEDIEDVCDDEKPAPPPPPEKIVTTTLVTGNSGNLSLPASTFKVTVDLIERPSQEKIQFGMLGEDVIYAGWCWFSTAGAMTDRMPVDADFKAYAPPARLADSFQFTLYKGYRATIRAYYITS